MKLIDVEEKHQPFDVASGQAEALLATGKVKRYEPFTPAQMPRTTWRAAEGFPIEDDVLSPVINYSCASCGVSGQFSGPTCERTQKFHHCNTVEAAPADVQRAFRVLRIEWEKTHKTRPANPLFGAPSYGYEIVPGITPGSAVAKQIVKQPK